MASDEMLAHMEVKISFVNFAQRDNKPCDKNSKVGLKFAFSVLVSKYGNESLLV